jgi:hypothetical protein
MCARGSYAQESKDDTIEVVMAAQRPDFDGKWS